MRNFSKLCVMGWFAAAGLACSGAEVEKEEPTSGDTTLPDLGKTCPDPIGLSGCSESLQCLEASLIGGRVCSKTCDVDAECPTGSVCLIVDRDDGHVCARLCESDSDCEALNPNTACQVRHEISTTTVCGEKKG